MLTPSPTELVPLPLLADPDHYQACPLNLYANPQQLDYWLDLFASHAKILQSYASKRFSDDVQTQGKLAKFAKHFGDYLIAIKAKKLDIDHLDIITICSAREDALRFAGLDDVYQDTKVRENKAAAGLYLPLIKKLESLPADQQATQLILGIFAGNIFDLGATQTASLFSDGQSVDFYAVRKQLKPRPWLFDDLDAWIGKWQQIVIGKGSYKSVVMFVDNAGCDIVLGMLPLARMMLHHGIDVLLTANTLPTLNDVTHDELVKLVDTLAKDDPVLHRGLASGQLALVASGNDVPLIDLSRLSPQLANAVQRRQVDLVILEGMGRAVESNLHATFTCDSMKLAMLKDQGVAQHLGGELFDLVMRFDQSS